MRLRYCLISGPPINKYFPGLLAMAVKGFPTFMPGLFDSFASKKTNEFVHVSAYQGLKANELQTLFSMLSIDSGDVGKFCFRCQETRNWLWKALHPVNLHSQSEKSEHSQ